MWENVPPTVDIIIASILTLIVAYFHGGLLSVKTALISILLFFLFILLWSYATSPLYSPGDDEYAYHLTAIWDLADGWNPLVSPHNNIWVDSYPNGYWVLQSYIVALTGNLLSGQSLMVSLMVTTAILIFDFFRVQLSSIFPKHLNLISLILAGIIVGNPIVLTQILTHYTDAPLYIMGCALVIFLMSDVLKSDGLARLGVVSCIILLINTKTAALYYVPVIVFGGFLMDLIVNKSDRSLVNHALSWILSKGIIYGAISILAAIVIGYKPYITNLQDHLALLYPAVDEIMSYNIPNNVQNIPTPMKFFYGVFSETGPTRWPFPYDSQFYLKIPGTFNFDEFKYLRFDTRRGGFGPFFSLALLTSIIAYISCRIARTSNTRISKQNKGDGVAAFAAILLVMSMFFPESWWARYIPFAWLSVVLFFVATFFLKCQGLTLVFLRALQLLALLSFLLSILAGLTGAARQLVRVERYTSAVEAMKDFPEIEMYAYGNNRITLDDQSKSISDAAQVWSKLFSRKGVNMRFTGEEPPWKLDGCYSAGWLEGLIFWCVPATVDKIPPKAKE